MYTVTLPRLLAAAAIGVAYQMVVSTVWGRYMALNPVNGMLLDVLARNDHLATYRVAITLHDIVVNILAALPFAAAFLYIRAIRGWTYILLAAGAALIVTYGPTNTYAVPLLLRTWGFWFGAALVGLSLPAAFVLLDWMRLRFAKNATVRSAALQSHAARRDT